MNQPNYFLIQRRALARFKRLYPFLALIPPPIYNRLSPISWYEPFGEIEQIRAELEEELNCYVMLFKRYGPEPPWEAQLFVYLHVARLTLDKQAILTAVNEGFQRLGIEAHAYQKPLKLRKRPLEHPFAHCDPPDADEYRGLSGLDPEDEIPF
jgi:hypothetical protein